MTRIVIIGPSDCAVINCVHLWTLKYIDNTSSFLKGPQKVLLVKRYGNRTAIINENGNSIGDKVSLARLVNGVGCTSNASDVR